MKHRSNPVALPRKRPAPAPEEIEVGVIVAGGVRVRCLLDTDWGSVLLLRVAPGEVAQYLGVVASVDGDNPRLHIAVEQAWRLPTMERREELRRAVAKRYRDWKLAH
jgi:hypothetical protein